MTQFTHRLLIGVIPLVLLCANVTGAPRKVLAELFTNTGCPPCYTADNYYFNTWLPNDLTTAPHVVTIAYHVWWPSGSDPMYLANPGVAQTRLAYCTNNNGVEWYVPHMYIDGLMNAGYDYTQWPASLSSRLSVSSPISVTLSGGRNNQTLNLTAAIYAESAVSPQNWRIRWIVVESDIQSPQYTGSTWVPFTHHWVQRTMHPNTDGQAISIAQGQTINMQQTITLDQAYAIAHCKVIVFVQDDISKEVINTDVINVSDLPLAVPTQTSLPVAFTLAQNYPNPFNPTTTITFALPTESRVSLSIFNILGEKVVTILDETHSAGTHTIGFDASGLASGVYLYRMHASPTGARHEEWTSARKMVIMR